MKKQIKYLLIASVAPLSRFLLLVPTPVAINFDFDAPLFEKIKILNLFKKKSKIFYL
jgi:hypothetical protein